jgi:hypothetical protein
MKTLLILNTYQYLSNDISNRIKDYFEFDSRIFVLLHETKLKERSHRAPLPLFLQYFLRLIKLIYLLQKANKSHFIVSYDDLSFEYQLLRTFFTKKIFIIIQAALFETPLNTINLDSKLLKFKKFFYNISFGIKGNHLYWGKTFSKQYLLIWGSYFKSFFLDNDNIKVIGAPVNLPALSLVKKQLRRILIIGAPDNETSDDLISYAIKLQKENPELEIAFKPHPRWKQTKQAKFDFDNLIHLKSNLTFDLLLEKYDLVISYNSASAYQAIASSVPVVIFRRSVDSELFFNHEVFRYLEDYTSFGEILDEINNQWEVFLLQRKSFLKDYLNAGRDDLINVLNTILKES